MALDTNLTAHYLLENNSDDSVGTNDGTDTSITYDGDSAEFASTTSEILFGSAITCDCVSFWHKNVNTVLSVVFKITDNTTSDAIELLTDGKIQIKDYDGNNVVSETTTVFSDSSKFHHIVLNNTGSALEIYVGGVKLSTTGTYWDFNSVIGIGQTHVAGNANNIKGEVSNLRLYSDSKNQAFVDDLYSEGYIRPTVTASIAITATAVPKRPPKATATIEITASASAFEYVPIATATVVVTASAVAKEYAPNATADVTIIASATVEATVANRSMFTFVYSIQQSQPETKFEFVYSIEQPKTATIIKRVQV